MQRFKTWDGEKTDEAPKLGLLSGSYSPVKWHPNKQVHGVLIPQQDP